MDTCPICKQEPCVCEDDVKDTNEIVGLDGLEATDNDLDGDDDDTM